MVDTLDQNEAAAAELLAHGFMKTHIHGSGAPVSLGEPLEQPKNTKPTSCAGPLFARVPTAGNTNCETPPEFSPTSVMSGGVGGLFSAHQKQAQTQAISHSQGRGGSTRGATAAGPRPSRSTRGLLVPGNPIDSTMHPVVRLGWTTICQVFCNGLCGDLLGGHDRDVFIRCTSGHYACLPPIEVALGGCIMTCSQFEKFAGRELSKKWKESIHVVGEGEGSKATLLSWLKRQAEREFGDAVVGRRVWVCWCADSEFYQGTIIDYNRESGKHTVQYSSRLVEELHLPVELLSFDATKPAAQSSPELELSAQRIALDQVWHQGSGVSVDSLYVCEEGPVHQPPSVHAVPAQTTSNAKPPGRASGQRRPRALLGGPEANAALPPDAEAPPPKRALSAPAAVLLAAVASAAAYEAEAAAQVQCDAMTQTGGTSLLPGSPLTPSQLGYVDVEGPAAPFLATPTCEASLSGQNSMKALPVPPRLEFLDGDASRSAVSMACRWLNELALHLDLDLSKQMYGTITEEEKHPQSSAVATNLFVNPSVSGRFQALVASLRGSPALMEGIYDAMVSRYDFFKDDFALQRIKMAELVAALVDEAGRGIWHELKAGAVGQGDATARMQE